MPNFRTLHDYRQKPKHTSPQSFVTRLYLKQAIQNVAGKKAATSMTQEYSKHECCPVHPDRQIRKQTGDGNWKHLQPHWQVCHDECMSQNGKDDGATESAPQHSLVDELHSAKDPESATAAFEKITPKHTATYREEEALKAALHTIERYSLHPDAV